MSKKAIEVKEFSFFYGNQQALFDVSMIVKEKHVTAIIGPSGCGKSTMIRCVNRMNDFMTHVRSQGQIFLQGRNILAPETHVVELRCRVGMVFQKPNPFPKSIYKNITWGPKINGMSVDDDELVERSLTQAALWDEVKDRLHDSALTLSGGQQQRLCIARTLAMNPEIILMDEPCSALDPRSTARIEKLISHLRKEYTIVIVTHNMQQALRVSDETAFFCGGRLVEMGATQEMFTQPKVQQTADYTSGRFG